MFPSCLIHFGQEYSSKEGAALITKAGTDQQTFNYARYSRSGVQFIYYFLQSLILKFFYLLWKSGEEDFKGDSNGSFSLDSQTMKKQ